MTVDSELYRVTNKYLTVLNPKLASELKSYVLRDSVYGNLQMAPAEIADLKARIKESIAKFKNSYTINHLYFRNINDSFNWINFKITSEVEKFKKSFLAIIANSSATLPESQLISKLQNFLTNDPSSNFDRNFAKSLWQFTAYHF